MELDRFSLPTEEVVERVRLRLHGGLEQGLQRVIWERNGSRLLLYPGEVKIGGRDGWLVVNVPVETDPTGKRVLQLVFHLGVDGRGDGNAATGTFHIDSVLTEPLVVSWGKEVQRLVWDGVLDVIEGLLNFAERHRGGPLTLLGFTCSEGELHVDVLSGRAG